MHAELSNSQFPDTRLFTQVHSQTLRRLLWARVVPRTEERGEAQGRKDFRWSSTHSSLSDPMTRQPGSSNACASPQSLVTLNQSFSAWVGLLPIYSATLSPQNVSRPQGDSQLIADFRGHINFLYRFPIQQQDEGRE
jgi:hypothetical protein